jgi:DNA-binding MarR family transcriptional regulator
MELTIDLSRSLNIGLKGEVVLAYIENNPGSTQKKIAKETGISSRTLWDIVDDLKSRDLIEKAGWYLYAK